MSLRAVAALFSLLLLTACDRNDSQSDRPSDGQPINGTERIEWDQQAADPADLSSLRYAIYVDRNRSELAASCADSPGSLGFPCSAPLPQMSPGVHILELAAFVDDGGIFESERSAPISVVVAAPRTNVAPEQAWDRRVTTADGVRLHAELITDTLEKPTQLAFASDGRLFIAEQAGRIHVVRDGSLQQPLALTLEDIAFVGEGGLQALALDPEFDRTHFVYAAYTAESPSGTPVFRVARFREVRDTLADRVVLLDEVRAAPVRASVALTVGPDQKLYAAFDDGGDARSRGDLASFNGKILRINPDASTPVDQTTRTPLYSYEYASPRGLAWQSDSMLWIADGGRRGEARLSVVSAEEGRRGSGTRPRLLLPQSTGVSSLTFYRASRIPAFQGNLLVAAEEGRHLLRLGFDARDSTRLSFSERLLQDRIGPIRTVAVSPDGAIYIGTDRALWRLLPE
jgi:glucose/arabinose dehydrogenase